jgi:acyl carrier protein
MAVQQNLEEVVKGVMADVLGVDASLINDETGRDNTVGWDSANHITLVLALEEEFGVTLEVSEIESMFTFADIVQTIGAKL